MPTFLVPSDFQPSSQSESNSLTLSVTPNYVRATTITAVAMVVLSIVIYHFRRKLYIIASDFPPTQRIVDCSFKDIALPLTLQTVSTVSNIFNTLRFFRGKYLVGEVLIVSVYIFEILMGATISAAIFNLISVEAFSDLPKKLQLRALSTKPGLWGVVCLLVLIDLPSIHLLPWKDTLFVCAPKVTPRQLSLNCACTHVCCVQASYLPLFLYLLMVT